MNYSTAVFLINPDVRAISAIYEADTQTTKAPRSIFKTFDKAIKEGDLILVPTNTRHNVTVCKVVETDIELDIETGADIQWVIGTVDMAPFEEVKALEGKAISQMKAAEAAHRREELRKKLLANMDESQVQTLAIAQMKDVGETPTT